MNKFHNVWSYLNRGGLFHPFSSIFWLDLIPRCLGVVLDIKLKMFFKMFKIEFLPQYQGSEKLNPPFIWRIMKIILEDYVIA